MRVYCLIDETIKALPFRIGSSLYFCLSAFIYKQTDSIISALCVVIAPLCLLSHYITPNYDTLF